MNFIKTVKSQVGKETISLWKPTVMRKQRQSSGPGVAKMFRISLSRLSHGRSEALRDTSELLFPEENDGYSTIEIFNQEGESIMTNALNEDNYERND